MYKLVNFSLVHYEELVDMFYEFMKEVYYDRKIGLKYAYYIRVNEWIERKCHIVVCLKDDIPIGFTMSYIDNMGGLTEPVYQGEIAYVKPEYRKTRASYLLYSNVVQFAEESGIKLVSRSRIENGIDKMIKKHYNVVAKYIEL